MGGKNKLEKIKLKDDTILELIPMGITTKSFEKKRTFRFMSEMDYNDVETAFVSENVAEIEYLSASDDLLKVYTDNLSLISLTKEFNREIEDGVFSDVYIVVLETQ